MVSRRSIFEWFFRILALIVGFAFAFILIEWGFREWYPQRLMAVEFSYNGWRHIPHKTIRHAQRGLFDVTFRYNTWAMKDYEYTREKPAGVYRILVLGDSWGENLQVSIPETFDNVLEARLNQTCAPRRFEVLNASVYAYDTAQELMYFRHEGWLFQPDLVILLWTGKEGSPFAQAREDGRIVFLEPTYTWSQRVVRRLRTWVRANSHFASFVIDRLNAAQTERDLVPAKLRNGPAARAAPHHVADGSRHLLPNRRAQLALLVEAKQMIEATGARFLVVPVHFSALPKPYAQLFQERHIAYVDPAKVYAVEQDPMNLVANYLNAGGNKKFAEVMFEALEPRVCHR